MTSFRFGRRLLDPDRRCRRWIDPRVYTLPLGSVIAYLRRRGWTEMTPDRKHFFVFREPPVPGSTDEPFFCQFVPDSEADDAYRQDMFDLLTGLAEFEERWASHIIDDILAEKPAPAPTNGPAAPTAAQPATR